MRDLRLRRRRGPGDLRRRAGRARTTTTATGTATGTGTTDGHHVHVEPDPGLRTHTLELEVAVLAKNDELAARNRAWLAERGITALNLMSSPGAGKTTLLERTIAESGRPGERDRGRPGDAVRRRADPRPPGPARSR